jgi:3-oxoacyl-[acyl-carrier protein] reductase
MDLAGKVAFVTGGSGDIGKGIARALAEAGADVALSYVGHREGAAATADVVQSLGRRSLIVQLDQRDPDAIDRSAEAVLEGLGRADVLVNNAGWNIGIPFPALDQLTADIWNRVHETNLRGPYLLSRAFAPHLRAHGAGRIVNIASVGGLSPSSSSIAYSASKAGLIHLTRCLAVALAPTITVNCVAPGLVEGTRIAQRLPPAVAERARQQAVLGRTASVDDIAAQVVAFCRADSVTGQVLVVDGGMPGGMH